MQQYIVVRTQFHGGGKISEHRTLAGAEKARRRYIGECTCGCARVVTRDEWARLKSSIDVQSPYAPAR